MILLGRKSSNMTYYIFIFPIKFIFDLLCYFIIICELCCINSIVYNDYSFLLTK